METFHIIVISVATIILLLILIFIGILLSKGNQNLAWPPSYGICPDYWMHDLSNNKCIIPKFEPDAINIGNMYDPSTKQLKDSVIDTPGYSYDMSGTVLTQYIDFSDNLWESTCDKKKWCNTHNIVWDGISNYNNC
jgi:hypothetical protein